MLKLLGKGKEFYVEDLNRMVPKMGLGKQSMPLYKFNLALYELGYRQKFHRNKSLWKKV